MNNSTFLGLFLFVKAEMKAVQFDFHSMQGRMWYLMRFCVKPISGLDDMLQKMGSFRFLINDFVKNEKKHLWYKQKETLSMFSISFYPCFIFFHWQTLIILSQCTAKDWVQCLKRMKVTILCCLCNKCWWCNIATSYHHSFYINHI